jgi:3-oxoacyl-[acyl-carrier-protein] synthase-3
MISDIKGIHINVINAALPHNLFTVTEYTKGLVNEKDAKRLAKNTGFEMLRISDEFVTTADLCFKAAENIFSKSNMKKEDIDAVVFVSQTSDYILPATSHVLQNKLGLSENIVALDINQGCSGYIYGLYISSMLVSTGNCRNVLLCAGDTISKLTAENDRATRTIFGDAGTATIISKGNDRISFNFNTLGKDYSSIIVENNSFRKNNQAEKSKFLSLDGMKIMNFTLDIVPQNIKELLNHVQIDKNEISLYACHQANKLILLSLADKLEIDREKLPFVANKIGNTSSASIPLLFTENYYDKQAELKKVIACGFGVGLSVATAYFDLSDTNIIRTIEL